MAKAWFALRTRSRAEKRVRDELDSKGLEPFLPTHTRWSRWKDRAKAIDWPAFPGYCFARFDPSEWQAVVSCSGVVEILSFGNDYAVIPDREIENLQRLMASQLAFDPVPMIRTGSMVEVVQGPLKGAVGRLMGKGRQTRIILSIDLIGRPVSAEVDAWEVRPY